MGLSWSYVRVHACACVAGPDQSLHSSMSSPRAAVRKLTTTLFLGLRGPLNRPPSLPLQGLLATGVRSRFGAVRRTWEEQSYSLELELEDLFKSQRLHALCIVRCLSISEEYQRFTFLGGKTAGLWAEGSRLRAKFPGEQRVTGCFHGDGELPCPGP